MVHCRGASAATRAFVSKRYLPHTATGKLNKLALRALYQDHLIESAKLQA
jgi:hypothetical protein